MWYNILNILYFCITLIHLLTPQRMKNVMISRKKSGNYIITDHTSDAWSLYAVCNTPSDLFYEVKKLTPLDRFTRIIKSEYRRSQLVCRPSQYTEKDALRAFGLQATNENVAKYF